MVLRDSRLLALCCFSLALVIACAEPAKNADRPKTDRATVLVEQKIIRAHYRNLAEALLSIAQRMEKSTEKKDVYRAKELRGALEEAETRGIEDKLDEVCMLLKKESLANYKSALSKAKAVAIGMKVVHNRLLGIAIVSFPPDELLEDAITNELVFEKREEKTDVVLELKKLGEAQTKLVGEIEKLYKELLEEELKKAKNADRPKIDRAKVAAEQGRIKARYKQLVEVWTLRAERMEKNSRKEDAQLAKDIRAALEEGDIRGIVEKMDVVCKLLDKESLDNYKKALSKAKAVAADFKVVHNRAMGIALVANPIDFVPECGDFHEEVPVTTVGVNMYAEISEGQSKLIGEIEKLYNELLEEELKGPSP